MLTRNLVLVGMPGAGKSTVGVLVARTLGAAFIDTDLLIQQRAGKLLQEIIAGEGIDAFLDLEASVIEELSTAGSAVDGTVIATGGSAVLRGAARETLRRLGRVLYLDVSVEELQRRVTNIGSRGIAMEPETTLRDLHQLRDRWYHVTAHGTVRCDGRTLEEVVDQVVAAATCDAMQNATCGSMEEMV